MNFIEKISVRKYIPILMILLFSLAIRLYYLVNIPHPPLIHDAHNYDVMAKQFLERGFLGYASSAPNAYITPGYPLFLALLYKIFGYSQGSPLTQVRIVQVILSTLTILLLYLLAKEMLNYRVAILSAFFSSIYLISVWVPTLILTETLYTFLFMLYLYIQVAAINRKSLKLNFISGVALALAVLVRPLIAPLIILPYIYSFTKNKKKLWIKFFLANMLGFIVVMVPWWLRNVIVLNKFIIFATQEDPLLRGTYPYDIGVENIPYSNQKQEALKRLKEGFATQPLLYLQWYTIGKFEWLYFKIFYYVDEKIRLFRSLLPLHNFFVWFGWVGVILSKTDKKIRLIALYIIFLTLGHLVFIATSRYSYPQMQLLIVLTAYIIDKLFFTKKTSEG